uniref:Seipin n=1 Tax=Acrobeloides nanus TaxID=290746 RepID=A0A914CHX6_9BILA
MDELSGVCSYPQADILLEDREIDFTPGNTYGFQLEVEVFDDDFHKQFGIFMVQLQTKDNTGTVVTTYKKPVTFREPSRSILKTIRNLIFWPLYLVGYFNEPPSTSRNILFTNQFVESSKKRTSIISVQLQHRYIQVDSAFLQIRAYMGISSYIFTAYPIITYVSLFIINLIVLLSVFTLYWTYKGLNVVHMVLYEEEENKQPEVQQLRPSSSFSKPLQTANSGQEILKRRSSSLSKTATLLQHLPLFNRFSISPNETSKNVKNSKSPKRSPSPPPIPIKEELPECPYLENIPGWNVIPRDVYGNNHLTRRSVRNNFNSKFFE